jgi:exopolysaccharide production protein ExoY
MSLVGPRPIVRDELSHYAAQSHWYLSVRPGITGPWQVSGRSDTGYVTRVRLDVEYAKTPSLRRDARIILQTAGTVLTCKGAY